MSSLWREVLGFEVEWTKKKKRRGGEEGKWGLRLLDAGARSRWKGRME